MEVLDYLVIGAGPAGLQLGYFFERAGRNYRILERTDGVGAFFRTLPRNRELLSFNKVYSIYDDPEIKLRWDWNSLLNDDYTYPFAEVSKKLYPHADELVAYLEGWASRYALKIDTSREVVGIARDGEVFVVQCAGEVSYRTRALIVATGFSRPHIPKIPGIELAEAYETMDWDPTRFTGRSVLIIGKGNSGFEVAGRLIEHASLIHLTSPESIKLAWKSRHPGHVRANNMHLLDMYQLKLLNSVLDCEVLCIERMDTKLKVTVRYNHAEGEVDELLYDHVVRAAGFSFDATPFAGACQPEMIFEGRFPDMTARWESTKTRDMWFAGTLTQVRDFQGAGSTFIDGFRYNCRTLFHMLEERYFGKPLPHAKLAFSGDALTEQILDRVCRSSGLWAQFRYLCDAIVPDRKSGTARYFYELPIDYMHTVPDELGRDEYYTINFEWGKWDGGMFAIDRHPDHKRADKSVFLHPVIRRYDHGNLVGVHYMLEDLFGTFRPGGEPGTIARRNGADVANWHREHHTEPLRTFLCEQIRKPSGGAYIRSSGKPVFE